MVGGESDDDDEEVDVMYAFAARKRGGTLPPSFAVNTHKYDLLFSLVVDRPISDEDDDEADWPRREFTVALSYNEELPRSRSPSSSSSSSTAAKDSSGRWPWASAATAVAVVVGRGRPCSASRVVVRRRRHFDW